MRKSGAKLSEANHKAKLVFADQVIVSGANFATGLLLARFLGLEGYGQYVLTFGIVLFLAGVHRALIISPMMVTGPALGQNESKCYHTNVCWFQLLFCVAAGGCILWVGLVLSLFFPHWSLDSLLWPLLFVALSSLTQDFFRRYFFARNRAMAAFLNDAFSYGSRFVLLLLVGIRTDLNVEWALWIVAGTSAAATLAALVQYSTEDSLRLPTRMNFVSHIREHWRLGKWLIADTIAYWSSSRLLFYIVGAALSVASVGAMNAALNLLGIANILFLAMENLIPSEAARLHAFQGAAALNQYLRKIAIRGTIATITVALVAGLWAEDWLDLIYGGAYAGYGWLVWWWGLYYVLACFQRPLSAGLRVLGNTRAIFLASLAGSAMVLSMGYVFILVAALQGAMFLFVLTQLAILSVLLVAYRNTKPLIPVPTSSTARRH